MNILFLTNIPSPYRVEFFNRLGEYCNLTVLFERSRSSERDKRWAESVNTQNYKSVFLKGIALGTDAALCLEVIKYLKQKQYDEIVICGISTPTNMLAIQWCKLRGIPYCLEGDGGFAKSGKGIREGLKRHFVRGAKLYFSTGKTHDEYYKVYGADMNRIVRYPFTSLSEEDILNDPICKEEKLSLRKELGMFEEKIVLSVGQFIPRKGFDILIQACKQMDKRDIGVYIVGGEPTDDYLAYLHDNKLGNVHFAGFKIKTELIKYYKAADMFVLPTREDIWGLVVNEAMAYGLPVITTDRCIAGLELIKPGENGCIVPVGDCDALMKAILQTLDDNTDNSMTKSSLKSVRGYTYTNMALAHNILLDKSCIERL